MEEIYKNCFEDYEISNLGNCRKKLKNGKYKIIKGSIQSKGYRYFQLNRNNKRINKLFHQLVAKCFIGERPDNLVIDHIDRNKLNNNVNNLRYISFYDNLKNCNRYRDDIKETGKERHNIFCKMYRDENIKEKKYICHTCPLITHLSHNGIFGDKRQYTEHINSELHIKRLNRIEIMKKNNIEVNEKNYKKYMDKISQYKLAIKNGKCWTKPEILCDEL